MCQRGREGGARTSPNYTPQTRTTTIVPVMPVTFCTSATVTPKDVPNVGTDLSAELFLKRVCKSREWEKGFDRVIQSSVKADSLKTLWPQSNGFVHTVIKAYGSHFHLTIRSV